VQHLVVPALCLWMLVADGGPAHHWQAADRHGQEADAMIVVSAAFQSVTLLSMTVNIASDMHSMHCAAQHNLA